MTDKTISDLTAAGTLTGAEVFPLVQSGANRKATLADLLTYIGVVGNDRVNTTLELTEPATPTATSLSLTGYTNNVPLNLGLSESEPASGFTDNRRQWYLGYNVDGAGLRVDDTEPAVGISFAINQFNRSDEPYGNLGFFTTTTDGTARPFLSFEWPHNTITGTNAQGYIHAQQFAFYNWAGDYALITFNCNSNKIFLGSSTTVQATNNVRVLEAINAAGSASVELMTLDTSDRFRTGAPLYINLPSTTTQAAINTNISGSALANNYALQTAAATGTTGAQIYAYSGVINAPGGLTHLLQNNVDATAAGTKLTLAALYGQSGCDVKVEFVNYNTGGTAINYAAGIDMSASAWKLSASTSLGTNDRITVDANTVSLGLPAKLPSYTVAGVPSASTAGAGAMIYVSNESGGAVPAFSDGTNWRRVTDRVVVS